MSKHSYYTQKKPHMFSGGGELKGWQKGLGLAGSLAPTLVGAIQEMNSDTSTIQDMADAKIRDIENQRIDFTGMSLDDVLNQQAMFHGYDLDDKSSDFYQRESTGSILGRAASSAAQGAASGSSMGPWGAAISGIVNGGLTLAGGLFGRSSKQQAAEKAAADVLEAKRKKNAYNQASFTAMASSLQSKNDRNLFTQAAAYGGPLGISLRPVDSAIDYMQNEELLTQLGEDMTKRNNRRTSMPLFAFGGAIPGYGGNWTNGLSFVNAGGSHEQNPMGGVPFGIAEDGNPNMVEEGEVVWNDYVYSNRLKVPKDILKKYKLGGNLTFAEAVNKAQKNYSERPNDPIEKRSTDAILAELMQAQEQVRAEKAQQDAYNEAEAMASYAADGGDIHIAKNKRGTFTAAASKHGMGVQEFAGHVLANKDKYSSAMVKKANFARNASKWHHALGGHLFPWGGHFDADGNYVVDPMPATNWNLTTNNGVFSDNYNLFGSYDFPIFNPTPKSNVSLTHEPKLFGNYDTTLPTSLNENKSMFRDSSGQFGKDAFGMEYKPLFANTGTTTNNNTKGNTQNSNLETWLRYIPILGNSIGLATSWASEPDYSNADELDAFVTSLANEATRERVAPTHIGNYTKHNPFDRLFYANELGARTAGTNSAIMNTGNANMGATTAALLANNYNGIIGQGKLFREGEEFNLAQRQKVDEFNRGTDMFNAEADLKAQIANAEADRYRANILLNAKTTGLGWKQAADQARKEAIWANASNLFQGLGDIGWEAVNRNMIVTNPALYYSIDNNGNISYKGLEDLSERQQDYVRLKAEEDKKSKGFACGGYLTIKNRRRK